MKRMNKFMAIMIVAAMTTISTPQAFARVGVAIGDRAIGGVAIGDRAIGGVAIGDRAIGGVAIGDLALTVFGQF